jgi:hypothetical protein
VAICPTFDPLQSLSTADLRDRLAETYAVEDRLYFARHACRGSCLTVEAVDNSLAYNYDLRRRLRDELDRRRLDD